MRAELSSFTRDAVMTQRREQGIVWDPCQIDFDRVADEVLERMDELTEGASREADPSLLIEERMNG